MYRWEAAKALSDRRGCVPELLRVLTRHQDHEVRAMLLYAISHNRDEAAFDALREILADSSEPPPIRGQCAEGLAYLLWPTDRRRARYKAAIRTLISALDDPSPIVRFWAVFALGSGGIVAVLPKLRRMAKNDRAKVAGWWLVSEESADAIIAIETGLWPDVPRRTWAPSAM
ncbi:MAG: HEAT repeat domain-containing protein [Dongiaceae bacterium]